MSAETKKASKKRRGPGHRKKLTPYDVRQLRLMRQVTDQVLRNLAWMEEAGRSAVDRELRAMSVSGSTAYVSLLAKNFERRWSRRTSSEEEK